MVQVTLSCIRNNSNKTCKLPIRQHFRKHPVLDLNLRTFHLNPSSQPIFIDLLHACFSIFLQRLTMYILEWIYAHDKQGRIWVLTAIRWFTLGGEDDEAKTLIVSAVQRNIKRFVVKSAGHRQPR